MMNETYLAVRAATRRLCESLCIEDQVVQSMPDVSPTKWHLAHTTWFFETFFLMPLGEAPFDPQYQYLFNSYYNTVGEQYPRSRRGLMTRPTVDEVWRYRAHVDERVARRLEAGVDESMRRVVEVGVHHEQQHQELMLTDIKHVLFQSPLGPVYRPEEATNMEGAPLDFVTFDEGMQEVGYRGDAFCFDNERPAHRVFMPGFALATRLVTTAEYQAFIDDGGYERHDLWLSEGWDWVRSEAITAPLYWADEGRLFTLAGQRARRDDEPVVHVSLYEADAYARWAGARLPREEELEIAGRTVQIDGNFVERGALHPLPAAERGLSQLFGDAWEWTASAYSAYPGYKPLPGALGEYNGKFMCNQHVLRGGSCATARSHIRPTYRNFFPAATRWQFSAIRLAKDVR